MSTEFPSKPGIEREWHVMDAERRGLGKLASEAARMLMGKHKATYTPFLDTGDHVIVINAAKVKLTGKKDDQKMYRHFTGYPGGLVETGRGRCGRRVPPAWWKNAISGMLPKTKLGKQMYRKLQSLRGRQASAQRAEAAVQTGRIEQERLASGSNDRAVSWNGPPQDVGRPHFPAAGKGEITVNGAIVRNLFPDRSGARTGSAAFAGHGDGGKI